MISGFASAILDPRRSILYCLGMTIRPATSADVPQVIPMVARIAELHESWDSDKYGYKPNVAQMYRGWMTTRADDPRSVFLVAEREDRLVAFLIGTVEKEIPIYRLEQFGFIHDLWVEPNYRNEGIARQMTMLAIEKFRAIGVKQIRLDTHAKNDAARALFASCGFRPSVTEMLLEME
jgi:ribosomal protein S18 acetylase RimI-like enzyme